MKYLIYFISIIFLLGLNLGLFNSLQIHGQIPNLLFLFFLCVCLEKKGYDFFFVAFICGLFLDFYSAAFFGAFTFAFLILALSLYFFLNNLIVIELNWKTLNITLLLALFGLDILLWVYGFLAYKIGLASGYSGFKIILNTFIVSLFYNWLLLYPVYFYSNSVSLIIQDWTLRRRGIVK